MSAPTQRERYLREQITKARSRLHRSLRLIEIRAYADLLSRLERTLVDEQQTQQQKEITDANNN